MAVRGSSAGIRDVANEQNEALEEEGQQSMLHAVLAIPVCA